MSGLVCANDSQKCALHKDGIQSDSSLLQYVHTALVLSKCPSVRVFFFLRWNLASFRWFFFFFPSTQQHWGSCNGREHTSSIQDSQIWSLTTGRIETHLIANIKKKKKQPILIHPHALSRTDPWHLLYNTFVNLAVTRAHLCSSGAYISSAYATGWQMRGRVTVPRHNQKKFGNNFETVMII